MVETEGRKTNISAKSVHADEIRAFYKEDYHQWHNLEELSNFYILICPNIQNTLSNTYLEIHKPTNTLSASEAIWMKQPDKVKGDGTVS
uniref:N-acetyltransferase n=1 Tax=Loa loa TaxID=7209 RepID=A0A1I7VXH8_LOALO